MVYVHIEENHESSAYVQLLNYLGLLVDVDVHLAVMELKVDVRVWLQFTVDGAELMLGWGIVTSDNISSVSESNCSSSLGGLVSAAFFFGTSSEAFAWGRIVSEIVSELDLFFSSLSLQL